MSIQTSINDNSSLTMDLNDPLMIENLENCDQNSKNEDSDENKIQIEQHIIQLGCIKKEVDEEMCNFVNVDSKYQFSDIDTVIKEEAVELENVKQENMSIEVAYGDNSANISKQGDTCCNECGKEYNGYCNDCSSLTHFLNNSILSTNSNWKTKSIPIGVLEIKSTSDRNGVFALRTFPKSVIFGPFEGVSPVESTTGHMWKIKDRKLSNIENGNWMQYISTTGNAIFKNLDTFQFGGYLYYQTNREIHSGEELIVCYSEEEMQKSDNSDDYYYIPVNGNETQRLFACTLCGLGFSLEKCLNEHKLKCPHAKRNGSTKEIIECQFCNVWLEKQEYQEHHEAYCSKNHSSFRRCSYPAPVQRSKMNEGEKHGDEDSNAVVFSYELNPATVYDDLKPYFCDICETRYRRKDQLGSHIREKHMADTPKAYKCPQCSYESNYKPSLRNHMITHSDRKLYQCTICAKKFSYKKSLIDHMKDIHTENSTKDYKCPQCSYQTNHKHNLQQHLFIHSDVKPFQCGICSTRFTKKSSLKSHMKRQHSEGNAHIFKCPKCPFQTKYKNSLETHVNSLGCPNNTGR